MRICLKNVLNNELWREIIITSLFSLPILLTLPLIGLRLADLSWTWYLARVVSLFVYTALASTIYLLVFRKHISPVRSPLRGKLGWLVIGFVLALLLRYAFGLNVALSLLIGLMVNLAIVLVLRSDLLWDFLFSSLVMGLFYLFLFKISHLNSAVSQIDYWFTSGVTGITVWSVPIEELLLAFVLGGMIGPIYLAIKNKAVVDSPVDYYTSKAKKAVSLLLSFILLVSVVIFLRYMLISPNLVEASSVGNPQVVNLNQELRFDFDYPVNRKDLVYQITPSVEGEWVFEDNLLQKHFFRTLIFRPESIYQPNTEYIVQINNVSNVFGRGKKQYTQKFSASGLPTVRETSVNDGDQEVGICQEFKVSLDQPNLGFAQFNFRIQPEVELGVIELEDKKEYQLKPKQCLNQGNNYSLEIERSLIARNQNNEIIKAFSPETIKKIFFATKNAPNITQYSPKGSMILVDNKQVSISFSEEMSPEAVQSFVTISPNTEGNWSWNDSKNLQFVAANNWQYGTNYQIKIGKGLKDLQGGYLQEDVVLGFSTIGRVKVTGNWPSNGASGVVANSKIKVQFNQEVDHASAQALFSIYPEVSGSFSWEGNTMYFAPNGLEKDSSYAVLVGAGVKSIHGLDSEAGYKINFETEISTTMLDIPLDYQDRALSCELASLKMALNYRGLGVSENELIDRVGFDPTVRDGSIWGDPDNAFVGSIDGKQNSTGYGVHWDPLRAVANAYRSASVISGQSVTRVSEEIQRGNPVVVWGVMGAGKPDQWTTPSGKVINTVIGEHVRLVIGYTGKASNPLSFIINDPIKGRIKWTRSQFESNWAVFGNKGVVVY